MRTYGSNMLCLTVVLAILLVGGCRKEDVKTDSADPVLPKELGMRIGSVAGLPTPEPVAVQGYGLVVGLSGTGSASCPPELRDYLKRYIATQMSAGGANIDELINSRNTAVVRLEAEMPAASMQGERFDVRISLPASSESTSLHGGWLYKKAELRQVGRRGATVVATVEGPVFINGIGVNKPDPREGHILGGGRVSSDYLGVLTLRKADYVLASRIRNRLNGRYGQGTAEALSAGMIALRIPPEYRLRRFRFLRMVGATYLDPTPELTAGRINAHARGLIVARDKEDSEIALEALGRECLPALAALLNDPDEEVRFRAARCMLNLRDDRGFATLREISLNGTSPRRLEALGAVAISANRNDAATVARRLLRDSDPAVLLAAYEHLRRVEDLAVRREVVGRSFSVEQVAQTDRNAIYVTRSGDPRIVLFGAPLTCRNNIFVESPDGMTMVNSQAGQGFVSLTCRHPERSGAIGPVRTGFDLADIIRALGTEPTRAKDGGLVGLGVSYTDVTAIVQQLAVKDVVSAEFWPGPLPAPGLIIKK
jgi:flagellar basal body P-ring protein FlgI